MSQAPPRRHGLAALFSGAVALPLGVILGAHVAPAREPPAILPLLASGETVMGQRIAYPARAPAKVTAAVVMLATGSETGWHSHAAPVFGYILEGEMTVDYGPLGSRVFRAGDGLLEAVDTPHNGRNTGAGALRILSVFLGAEGMPTAKIEQPPR